jgi:ABC-type protease/lipase transport system fused ATPase/permease subunit
VISHKTDILNIADKIMILQDGAIIKMGTREEMMEAFNRNKSTEVTSHA